MLGTSNSSHLDNTGIEADLGVDVEFAGVGFEIGLDSFSRNRCQIRVLVVDLKTTHMVSIDFKNENKSVTSGHRPSIHSSYIPC